MIKKRKLSLSILNSILLIVFLLVVTSAVLINSFYNTQEVVNKNIKDYFNQTYNLTNLVLENEQDFLDQLSFDVGYSLYVDGGLKEFDAVIAELEKADSIDDIDLMYIKTRNQTVDYSNTLFDTEEIIQKIEDLNLGVNNTIVNVKVDDQNLVIMLSRKKIVDYGTGRVNAQFTVGKIFNDNYSLMNKIRQKAKLEDIYFYLENENIASTNNVSFELSSIKKDNTLINEDKIYSLKSYELYGDKHLKIVLVSQNSSFELLKESFVNQLILLVIFVFVLFVILYYLSNRLIIKPFRQLVTYAQDVKSKNETKYIDTNVLEFDDFAYRLKDIIQELKSVKDQYSRAIDGVQDGLWDIDLINKKVFYSTRFVTMLGYEKDEKINNFTFWQRNIHKEDYAQTMNKLRYHMKNKTDIFETEYRFKCKNGNYKWIKIRGKVFFDENDIPSRMTGFHTDINDLISLQEENSRKEQMLYQQSKLAAMGEMIGNIAHQWRQPLTVIGVIGSTINMQIQLGTLKNDEAVKDLEKLQDTVQYLSSIIDKFRNFFNPDNKSEDFVISEAIKENIEIFESSYKSNNIKFVQVLEDVKVYGYKFELMQVIVNIINNSKDALVSKSMNNTQEKFIFMKSYLKGENALVIKIWDNAGGIPKDIKAKIYEPYFTTKHQSQGTGLGLYMSNEIIQKHFKGSLKNKTIKFEYEGNSYKGEEFTVEIPI